MRRQPPSSSLFPSTTLFRSPGSGQVAPAHLAPARPAPGDLVPGPLASARPAPAHLAPALVRSEEHTSELQSRGQLVCRLLPVKKKKIEPTLIIRIIIVSHRR